MSVETGTRASVQPSRHARLAMLAATHGLVGLAALGLFAAADSWNMITGLPLAGLLCVIAGVIAGIAAHTLVHEWFHLLGARLSGGAYEIPAKRGLFVYDWDFSQNSLHQFFIMSVAGSIGGALTVMLLWTSVPADTWGRAALRAAVVASFVYAALIEWPVLRRARYSGDAFAELSKIDQRVLTRSFVIAVAVMVVLTLIFLN